MKHIFISLFMLFAVLIITKTSKAQAVNVNDSLALVDLYNSTNGSGWLRHDNWLSGPVNTWYGITITGTRVSTVNLNHNQLSGTLLPSIGNLTGLRNLFLFYNQIAGIIPNTIGKLSKLQWLALESNKFTGSIPSSIGKLTNTFQITVNGNYLSGSIPASINNLTNLQYFIANYNQLTGGVPYIGGMTALVSFDVSRNNLYVSTNLKYKDSIINAQLNVSENFFTFDGLEYIGKNFPNAVYSPQYPLNIRQRGDSLYVYAGGTLKKNTYQWIKQFTNEKFNVKDDSAFHPTLNGNYSVLIANKYASKLTLSGGPVPYNPLPAAIKSTASTDEIKNTVFNVYPNPASTVVHVQAGLHTSVIITNTNGKVLLVKVINNSSDIDVSSYAAGIYYIQNKNTGETKQIIVVH